MELSHDWVERDAAGKSGIECVAWCFLCPSRCQRGQHGCLMDVFCLGENVIGSMLARKLIETSLYADFSGTERHRRRVAKVVAVQHPALRKGKITWNWA